MGTDHVHRVCTYAEAEEAIRSHSSYFVNDCFCRGPARAGETSWDYCGHDVDNCLGFRPPAEGAGYPYREITREEALEKLQAWKSEGNFFRFMEDDNWLCFCCSCGCGWFRGESGEKVRDSCTRSGFQEQTDTGSCTLCGLCVDVCPYGARSIGNGKMLVQDDLCYGCSACEHVCPEHCIAMVERAEAPTG